MTSMYMLHFSHYKKNGVTKTCLNSLKYNDSEELNCLSELPPSLPPSTLCDGSFPRLAPAASAPSAPLL